MGRKLGRGSLCVCVCRGGYKWCSRENYTIETRRAKDARTRHAHNSFFIARADAGDGVMVMVVAVAMPLSCICCV